MSCPKIFISSTCYDLGQIRADIKAYIENLGYIPVLSEYNTFPINPGLNTIENCISVVETEADIFILIVGCRYGSQDEMGKSITNMEYTRAKMKEIPTYVFVHKNILSMLPIWKDNSTGEFSSVVDSIKLFEFVENIRSKDKVWVIPFEVAQDITSGLQKQFAHIFYECLQLRKKMASTQETVYSQLKGEALKIALEKPKAWEYRLFSEILSSGINKSSDLRSDLKYQIGLQKGLKFTDFKELLSWINNQMPLLERLISCLSTLTNIAFVEAVGKSGQAGNPEKINYVAEKMVEVYKKALQWTLDVRLLDVPEDCKNLMLYLSRFCESIIQQVEKLEEELRLGITRILAEHAKTGAPVTLNIDLTFTLLGLNDFNKEISRLTNIHK